MSQVRKLLQGNKIPKAQEGYKFHLDSQDVYFTDDDIAEIDKRISALPMDHRRFLGNATTAIKSGEQSGNRAENTVTVDQLSNLGKGDMRRLEKKKGSYLESWFQPDSYSAKQAINEYLNILYSVANKRTAKSKIDKSDLSLVFNGDEGAYALSGTAGNNYAAKNRIFNILDSVNAGKDYKYDVSDWDLAWLQGWMDSLPGEDKKKAAQDYVNDLWSRMGSGYNPKLTPDDENFLKNFYISFGFNSPKPAAQSGTGTGNVGGGTGNGDETLTIFGDDGKVDYDKRASNGAYVTQRGKDGGLYVNSHEGDKIPYLLSSPERLIKYGLPEDYLNAVVFQGRIYKPSEVTPDTNIDLYNRMQQVITANNSSKNPNELYESLSSLVDYTDYDPTAYTYYNPEQHFWDNAAIRAALGRTGNYGLFDATPAYNYQNGLIYGVYDFGQPGTGQWGFRAPFYLVVDENGNLRVDSNDNYRLGQVPEDIEGIPNMQYGAGPSFGEWQDIENGRYAFARQIPAAEPSRPPYTIYEDFDGNWYYQNSSRGLIRLDDDLKAWLLLGNRPIPAQMEKGVLDPKGKQTTDKTKGGGGKTAPKVGKAVPAGASKGGGSRKEGGLIPVKPLPKYQMGSALLVKQAPTPREVPTEIHDPLSSSVRISDATSAEEFWTALSSAEKEEIIATSIDLGGAVAGLAGPVGSVAGAVTGLGSTAMFMDAAKKRKGSLDWGDYGQAALSTLLDVVSVLPWVGEAGKVAKIGNRLQKVAAPLGKIFTLMGLSAAATVITKPVNQWTTDDLVKLSSGLQAMTNIGNGMRIGRGESRLASRLSADAKPTEHVYATTNKYKRTEGGIEDIVKLDADDVNAVVNTEKTPAKTLRGILKDKYKVAEADLNKNDKALLEEFGFDTKQHRAIREKDRYVEAREVAPKEPEKFSKYGYLLDPIRIKSNPEIQRRAYIDKQLSNPKVAASLAPTRTKVSEQVGPRETITTYRGESPLGTAERRAYISSLSRLGKHPHGKWQFRTPIDEGVGESVAVDRSAQFAAENTIRNYESSQLPRSIFHDQATQMAAEYPKVHADAVSGDLIYSARAATKPSDKPKPSRSARLGAESVSNKELVDYIIGTKEEPGGIGTREAFAFLDALTPNKRRSVLKALANNGDQKALDILRHYNEDGSAKRVSDKLNKGRAGVSKALENMKKRGTEKKNANRIAENLRKLRESKDPMKTLSEISNNERSRTLANENPSEYRDALNEALREAIYSKLSGLRLDRYLGRVKTQMQRDGLLFRRGGVIKAQNGVGGGGIKGIGNWYSKMPLITELIDLAGTNIYNDRAINHKIKSDQYSQSHWIAPRYVYPTLDLSAEERQKLMLQEQRASNNPSFTSDPTALMAYKNQRNAQIDNSLNSVFSEESQKTDTYNQRVNEITNQQLQLDAQYANHNSDSIAASNAAQELHKAEGDLLKGQNFRNFMTYIKYLANKDVEKLDTASEYGLSQWYDDQKTQLFNREVPNIVTEYNALTPQEKLNYSDLSEYIQTKYPTEWLRIKPLYEDLYKQQINDVYKFKTNTTLLPYRPQNSGNLVYKKGGRVRGTTRYRNEPDEQVWIDSNKATQAAVAKLEDNVIKLLLRALR